VTGLPFTLRRYTHTLPDAMERARVAAPAGEGDRITVPALGTNAPIISTEPSDAELLAYALECGVWTGDPDGGMEFDRAALADAYRRARPPPPEETK